MFVRNEPGVFCQPHDGKRHEATSRGFVMSIARLPEVSSLLHGFCLALYIRKIRAIRSSVVKKCLVLASSAALTGKSCTFDNFILACHHCDSIFAACVSRQDLPHDVSMHIRGAEVAAGIAIGEFLVVQA